MGNSATRKEEIYALREEVQALRQGLQMQNAGYTVEMWEANGTQETRDMFAARALIQEYGNQGAALQRLGFRLTDDNGQWMPAYVTELVSRVLDTTGVRDHLSVANVPVIERWERILKRQMEVAEFGEPPHATSAAKFLAKAENLNKEKSTGPGPSVSLHVLVNQQAPGATEKAVEIIESHDPLAILAHEPSADGVAVDDSQDLPVR